MCSNVNISNDSKPEMQYLPPLAPIPVIDGPTRKRALERLENNNKGALLEPAAKRQAKSVDVSYRLVVHPAKLGRIIGKNGSHIKQLREETGAAVSIPDALTIQVGNRDFIQVNFTEHVAGMKFEDSSE
eukprot:Gb_18344 [translate_table: standard]